jgi:hypothetical protein
LSSKSKTATEKAVDELGRKEQSSSEVPKVSEAALKKCAAVLVEHGWEVPTSGYPTEGDHCEEMLTKVNFESKAASEAGFEMAVPYPLVAAEERLSWSAADWAVSEGTEAQKLGA